ncbi:MAG TPA: FAD-dependent oxidoreductase [Advenella kashmirensis]|uniref:FAD-dependent oxidoreductase n=1 Tax=Advenella kashmirensis TaxID=310575 RepID=A0A356LJ75_9BURK|nr:FAD-dependent oxidoreductase [Advenella kashmirensis]
MSNAAVFDYIVIGSGIAGASFAYQLSQRPGTILVLEREAHAGYYSTGRSAAMFIETYGPPQLQALTRACRSFFEKAQSSGFSEHPVLHPRGCIYVATHAQKEILDSTYRELLARAPNVEWLSAAQVLERVPCMKPDDLYGGIYERDAEDIDVDALHQGYLKGMKRNGVELAFSVDIRQGRRQDGVWILESADGRQFRARHVVNAAGAWADVVAQACGVQAVGIQPRRRSAFTFTPPEELSLETLPMVCDIEETYYFKPDAGQLLGSPANADDVEPQDVVAEELDIATGIYYIEQATTLQIRRPTHVWAGLRSFAPDGNLVIGWDPAQEGFFWLAGQGGYGIQSSDGVSRLAVAMALNEPVPDDLLVQGVDPGLLSPLRFRAG